MKEERTNLKTWAQLFVFLIAITPLGKAQN